jgi:hypothetical protein
MPASRLSISSELQPRLSLPQAYNTPPAFDHEVWCVEDPCLMKPGAISRLSKLIIGRTGNRAAAERRDRG